MIKNVLFDLDGTLLPMDMDEFTNGYFKHLVKKAMSYSDKYKPDELIKVIWAGVKAMVMNKGEKPNEDAFWEYFASVYGDEALKDRAIFDDFYANDFICAKDYTGYNEDAKKSVEKIKEAGYKVVLATNPIFPEIATRQRVNWTGMDVSDFEAFTSYENCTYCKPNPEYYLELLSKLNMRPEECLMVGNDVDEDMEAGLKAGMQVYLITDCMINKNNLDIDKYPHGSFNDLVKFLGL
ncbi:MAG: HAD family hydrolase [Lachnospiraceae bacterium]|nr:HAD family hydrolase [Lachnospiraceae bacterium]